MEHFQKDSKLDIDYICEHTYNIVIFKTPFGDVKLGFIQETILGLKSLLKEFHGIYYPYYIYYEKKIYNDNELISSNLILSNTYIYIVPEGTLPDVKISVKNGVTKEKHEICFNKATADQLCSFIKKTFYSNSTKDYFLCTKKRTIPYDESLIAMDLKDDLIFMEVNISKPEPYQRIISFPRLSIDKQNDKSNLYVLTPKGLIQLDVSSIVSYTTLKSMILNKIELQYREDKIRLIKDNYSLQDKSHHIIHHTELNNAFIYMIQYPI